MSTLMGSYRYAGPETTQPLVNHLETVGAIHGLAHIGPVEPVISYLGFATRQEVQTDSQRVEVSVDYPSGQEFLDKANALPRDDWLCYESPYLEPVSGKYSAVDFATTLAEDNLFLFDVDGFTHPDGVVRPHDVTTHAIGQVLTPAQGYYSLQLQARKALHGSRRARKEAAVYAAELADSTIANLYAYQVMTGTGKHKEVIGALLGRGDRIGQSEVSAFIVATRQRAYDLSQHVTGEKLPAAAEDMYTWLGVDENHLILDGFSGRSQQLGNYRAARARNSV